MLVRALAIFAIALVAAGAQGASWYVDSGASGANNGTSWANAWTSIAAIKGLAAGDTVYISGGPSGSSKTYVTANWQPAGGSSGNPITYTIGQDTSHNGTVVFSGSGTWVGGNPQYLVISGDAGDGGRHFQLSGFGTMFAAQNAACTQVRLAYIYAPSLNGYNGVVINQMNGFEFDHNYMYMTGSPDGAIHAWGDSASGYDKDRIHDNEVYIPVAGSGMGCDGFQTQGDGLSFYNNKFYAYVSSSWTGGQHSDGIQDEGGNYTKVYNNIMCNFPNYCIFLEAWAPYTHLMVYNNICLNNTGATSSAIVCGHSGNATSEVDFNDILIANNTVDAGGGETIVLNNVTSYASQFINCRIENNVIVAGNIGLQGNSSSTVANNAMIGTSSAGSYFVRYSGLGQTNNDFHLTSSATSLIGQGANLSSIFTIDKAGNQRPASGAWDLGAYQYSGSATTSPVIGVSPSSQNFGSIAVGTTADQVFTVKNTGTGTLSGSATVGAPYSVVSGSPYSVAAGASQAVTVRFSPTAAGTNTQTVAFSGGLGASVQVTGVATATAAPAISVAPASVVFGSVTMGATADQILTVKNTGTGTLSGSATVSAPFSVISGSPYSLPAGQSQSVIVRYSPTAAGTNNQTISFSGGNGASSQLSGNGVAVVQSSISVSPASQDFGSVTVGATVDRTFSVQNTGAIAVSGSASVAAPFVIVSGSPYSLSPGQMQTVTVRYNPTAIGTNKQSATFSGGNSVAATVSGAATGFSGLSFAAGAGIVTSPLTQTNGTIYQPTEITVVSNAGHAFYPFTIASAGDYTIQAVVNAPSDDANSFYVNVDGEPQDAAMIWDIPITSGFEQRTVSWRGSGTDTNDQFAPKVFTLTAGTHQLVVAGREANVLLQSLSVVPSSIPAITVTPTAVSFGGVSVGATADQVVTVQNTGSGTLSGSVSVSAPFSIVSGSSYTLTAGQSQNVILRYSPTAAGTNSQSAAFTGGNGATSQLDGVGLLPVLSVSPSSQDFGSMAVGTTADRTFVVQNTGTGTLSGSASVSAPFSVVSGSPYSLAAGQSQTITVRYSPTAAGTNKQTVSFLGGNTGSGTVSGMATAVTAPAKTFAATSGKITGPFVATNNLIYQATQLTGVTNAGHAVYACVITNSGKYAVQASVNAPSDAQNSLLVNFDAEPQSPTMIWDIPITSGFQSRVASWRGTGTDTTNQYSPKVFTLTSGAHQLIIVGREANVQVQSLSVVPVPSAPTNVHVVQ